MTPFLAIGVAAAICYLALPKNINVPRGTIEADFEEKKRQYERETQTEAETVEQAEIVQDSSDQMRCAPSLALPADLVTQVQRVKIDGKWRSVVDLDFITILPKEFKHD